MRFLVWLSHTIYRTCAARPEHVPGGRRCWSALREPSTRLRGRVAARSASSWITASSHPDLNFVFRTGRAIPIASQKENPALKEAAFEEVERALGAGDGVCIFPEGQITRTGDLSPFRAGVERMIARNPVPVVPMALRGLWGSFFSRMGGHAMRHPFRRFWSRIELVAGNAVAPADASAAFLQMQVLALRGDVR